MVRTFFEPSSPLFGPPSTELPKPPAPYVRGWTFTANSHIAPPPTLVVRDCCNNSEEARRERKELSPIDRCIKRPPLAGVEGTDTVSLEVLDLLKGGDGHNSQVFTARLLESTSPLFDQKGSTLVAKIYDPLYFNDDDGYLDPFLCIDKYYTHEANAYTALGDFQAQWIPKYYGSYSLTLPVDSLRTRVVRMILMEHIEGITMADANPREFSPCVRQDIMKSIVDLESRIYEKDIWLTDLEPRNIIIRSPASDHPCVAFIDLAHALFNRTRDDPIALQLNYFLGEYISPVLRWNEFKDKTYPFTVEGWIDWDWDSWLQDEFAHTLAGITPEIRERWSDE